MKMNLKTLIFALSTIFSFSQEKVLKMASESIDAEELREMLYIYSSDEFGGRGTPSKGQDLATNFLVNRYKKIGVKPLQKNNYFQEVKLQFDNKPTVKISVNGKKFEYYKEFISYNNGPNVKYDSMEIVFVGYGIDDQLYSDYKDLDVNGKVVVAIGGEPTNNDGGYIINGDKKSNWSNGREELRSKKRAAEKNGALSLILLNDYLFNRYSYEHRSSDQGMSEKRMSLRDDSNDAAHVLLFPTRFSDFFTQQKLMLDMDFEANFEPFGANNVVAYIEGSEFPDEYIILTAHLDHVGIQNGEIYNGADDDGSGTIGILEIAEAFSKAKKAGYGPKRSIIFLHVTAEERGLLGSQYYTDYEPLVPLKKTLVNLNIDMIGRTDPNRGIRNINYIYIIGSDILSDDLHEVNMKANEDYVGLELDYRYNDPTYPVFESGRTIENQYYYRSDHYHFAKNNIPVIFFFSGTHVDYHQPTDTAEKILYDLYEKRTKLIFHTAWDLANNDEKIRVNK
tara:strand:- start:149 stop:1672 length:1524 start_codon:yes stop_codon:yes gene_type:complete